MKKKLLIALLVLQFFSVKAGNSILFAPIKKQNSTFKITVPLAGNAYSSLHLKSKSTITRKGIENWTNPQEYFTVYIKIDKPGTFQINTINTVVNEKAVLSFEINNQKKQITFTANKSNNTQKIGSFNINQPGYIALIIRGLKKSGGNFPSIESLEISSSIFDGTTNYVPNDEDNFFYWGRRGPSVHLNYQIPNQFKAEWFYNEVTVPEGNDIIGSYFMANGFGEGYLGMQVNSESERRILFSVWSPFTTDNPESIPENQKIKLLKKGEEVYNGEFGNEGSGGQSYLKYNWKAGNTYKFLLHGVPNDDNSTTYTAYFYNPEKSNWQLIASFKRPQTSTYLKHLHSFLENFNPVQGNLNRKVLFGNQWIADNNQNWTEINNAVFTCDNTARKGYRMDYKGGISNSDFFLENCGFFNDFTVFRTTFKRPFTQQKPQVDLSRLP